MNICVCVDAIGRDKCKDLIGFHNFTGADGGEKCLAFQRRDGSPATYSGKGAAQRSTAN